MGALSTSLHLWRALFMVNTVTLSIRADFFMFKKMVHPQTGASVCLLYDVHASTVDNLEKYEKIPKTFKEIQNSSTSTGDVIQKIKDQYDDIQGVMSHLTKQRIDLKNLVKEKGFSLITEDWCDVDQQHNSLRIQDTLTLKGQEARSGANIYLKMVTPMLDIGKAITGSFSVNTFVPIGRTFFYNADDRGFLSTTRTIGETYAAEDAKVDASMIQAVEELSGKYQQSHIIVTGGFAHMVFVARALKKSGYELKLSKISADLDRRQREDSNVKHILTDLQNDDFDAIKKITFDNDLIYSLIAKPLDLHQIFSEEFPEIFQEEPLISLHENLVLMCTSSVIQSV